VIPDSEKRRIISLILSSPDFKDSKRYQELLNYLVEKSAVTDSIKEVEIAHDLFGKDANFDPGTDPLIRSYISNLRKKLEHYYLTTADRFDYKIEVPKGQYTVNYIELNKKTDRKTLNRREVYICLAIITLLAGFIVFQNFVYFKNSPQAAYLPNPVWSDFFNRNSPSTIIVLGDYFFLAQREKPGERLFTRSIKLNSLKEFEDSAAKAPELKNKFAPLEFTYLRPSSIAAIPEIQRVLGTSPERVTLKLASQLKWEDFNNHNIIYVGTFKTLYILDTLLAKTNIRYRSNPSALTVLGKNDSSSLNFPLTWRNGAYQYDYSLVLKLFGSRDNVILFLLGFSEIGVMHSIKASVDPNLTAAIEKFTKKSLPLPMKNFEMLFFNEGVDQTVFKSEMKYFNSTSEIKRGSR